MRNNKKIALIVVVVLLLAVACLTACTRRSNFWVFGPNTNVTSGQPENGKEVVVEPTGTCIPQSSPTDVAPEPTKTPTYLPTLTATPTATAVLPLDLLIEQARSQEMYVVILFTPAIIVEPYFNRVQVVEGYTPEQLLGPSYPEVLARVEAESYYKDYFRVILVGGFNDCYGEYCSDPTLYGYKNVYNGRTLKHILYGTVPGYEQYYQEIEFGGVVIHWHKDQDNNCLAGTFANFCTGE